MTKKKKIIIITSVISAVLVVALTLTLLLVFLLKPERATKVEVEIGDYQIYVKTTPANERTYKFKFEIAGDEVVLDSNSHILDITPYLWNDTLHLGAKYNVSVCLVEKTGVLSGSYGESAEFTPKLRLFSPQIEYDSQRNFITWQAILGADKYKVSYFDDDVLETVETTALEYDLSKVMGGTHNIFVTALSNNDGLLESDGSNKQLVTLDHQIAEISKATVSPEDKILRLECADKLKKVILLRSSDQVEITLTLKSYEYINGVYVLSFNFKLLDLTDDYTVKPLENEHNHYSFDAAQVEIENQE